jgi:hypothetical protein
MGTIERWHAVIVEAMSGRSSGMSDATRYLVYGLVVESDVELSSVEEASAAPDEAAIRMVLGTTEYFRSVSSDIVLADDWIQQAILADGSVYVKVEGVLETVVSADGRRAVCGRLGATDDRSFEANLLNFVVSTALTLQGEEPLHATVVDLGGSVVGLLGASGAGKSTLAACLIAQGARLITDDMLRLVFADGKAMAYPGPHRLKLFDEPAKRFMPDAVPSGWLNALSGKMMVEPSTAAPAPRMPRPLSTLFWLGEPAAPTPERVSLERMAGADLVRRLIASAMNIRYHAPERLARQLRFSEHIARTLPVYALNYPRKLDVMERVVEEIRRVAPA